MENFKTSVIGKIWPFVCLLFVAGNNAWADDFDDEQAAVHAYCAAAFAIVATQTEGSTSVQMADQGNIHREKLIGMLHEGMNAAMLPVSQGLSDDVIREALRQMQGDYDAGKISWEGLLEFTRSCAD